jgi:dienelactone hydrolase
LIGLGNEYSAPPNELSDTPGLVCLSRQGEYVFRFLYSLVALIVSAQATLAAAQPPRDWEGDWLGRCRIDGKDEFLRLRLEFASGRLGGFAASRSLAMRQTPLRELEFTDGRLALSFRSPRGRVRLSCAIDGDELKGNAQLPGQSTGECSLRRRKPVDLAAFDKLRGDYAVDSEHVLYVLRFEQAPNLYLADGDLLADMVPVGANEFLVEDLRTIRFETDSSGKGIAATVFRQSGEPQRAVKVRLYDEHPVTITSGDIRLAGTLTLPIGAGPFPALVFVHGSGPSLRNTYMLDADRFARNGIASLAFDKRGVGKSTGNWLTAGFDELADDVLAAVRSLRADKRIRPDAVGLFGISQAGWVIPLAASRSADVAFLVPVSGAAVTPAEQELWRHRQNLEFLYIAPRFIELERKSCAMAYDWQRRIQLGSMPIPSPFADDNLNMYHDAQAVLRQVKQPVLAILGGMDNLTPPHESAALWADGLRRGGNADSSVRLFPRGEHGLRDGGKSGSPLEVLRERRLVPGYFDTMVRWIKHHSGGPEFPEARQIDVDADSIPVESRGMQQVSWYGSGAVQPWQLLISLVAFASAVVALPASWLYRLARRVLAKSQSQAAGLGATPWLAAILGLLNVGTLTSMTYLSYQLVQARPHPVFAKLALIWNVLVSATWVSILLTLGLVCACVAARRYGRGSRIGRVYYSAIAAVSICWIPFVIYWDLVRPAW